jgi:hypothetical protein
MDAMLISREKLAYIVDATASPIASIAPISSWIGAHLTPCSGDTYIDVVDPLLCTWHAIVCSLLLSSRSWTMTKQRGCMRPLCAAHGVVARYGCTFESLHTRHIMRCAGYELSLIDDAYSSLMRDGANLESNGWTTSSFIVFLKTIPGRYYPWAMLVLQVRRLLGLLFCHKRCVVVLSCECDLAS